MAWQGRKEAGFTWPAGGVVSELAASEWFEYSAARAVCVSPKTSLRGQKRAGVVTTPAAEHNVHIPYPGHCNVRKICVFPVKRV